MATAASRNRLAPKKVDLPNGMTPIQFYRKLLKKGVSPKLAEALAHRAAPGIGMTDSIFMEGRYSGGGFQDEHVGNVYRQIARDNGVSPDGKQYCSQLASFPGDPKAWVDSVADVKRVAEEKNLILEGGIDHIPAGALDAPVDDLSEPYQVADDIVDEAILSAAEDNPDLADEWVAKPKKLEEAREQVKETFSGDVA